ncbi:hypothetical protein [Microbacterium rhizomatis]|uniref:Lipoprotein n=1 Tax=Microbacterium rhizomatis TaxID=1631477 RepID=A0A5J5J5N4_9MICO|nr:hypothetical protein [Microbacterium rhizomatis]KAA9111456.1 hypothetical protein F6B43_07760 [Microbacterium rhizomatis]
MVIKHSAMVAILALTGAALSACSSAPPEASGPTALFLSTEVMKKKAECLADKGWDVTFENGAIVAHIPEAQKPRYFEDGAACSDEVGGNIDMTMTPERIEIAYDWYVEIANCLTAHGYSVPERPTLAAFIDSFDSDPWLPFEDIHGAEIVQARADCPIMNPPGQK